MLLKLVKIVARASGTFAMKVFTNKNHSDKTHRQQSWFLRCRPAKTISRAVAQIIRLKYLLTRIFETNNFFPDLEFIKFDLDLICKPADLICDLKERSKSVAGIFLILKPRE